MNLSDAQKLWYESQPIEGILFGLNDDVSIISGEHSGKKGSVISLESLVPVTYLVELGADGNDIIVAESGLSKEYKD